MAATWHISWENMKQAAKTKAAFERSIVRAKRETRCSPARIPEVSRINDPLGDLRPVYLVSGTRDNPNPELPWERYFSTPLFKKSYQPFTWGGRDNFGRRVVPPRKYK